MKLKEILIGVATVVLVALVAVGATLAYLTATDEETNVMTVGDVDLEILEFERADPKTKDESAAVQKFNNDKLMIPPILAAGFDYAKPDAYVDWGANSVKSGYTSPIWDPNKISKVGDKMVFVKNTGKLANAYVRLYFAFEAGQYASFEQFQNKIHLNINETDWDWTWDEKLAEIKGMKCFVACATYKYAIAPGELTNISLSQIALDSYANNSDSSSFGEGYDVLVVGQGIQSDGMGTANAALDKGFGTEIPFAGFKYVDFTILKTALHNLNAAANNTITSKVNSVTFGLFKDHYEKIIGYDGVATKNVDNQEKFSAYTYYVPTSDDKYDIYVLTDSGVIYTPVISENLFYGMTVLTKVDTSNLDVSKATNMISMFEKCYALEEIDVSNWVVSNVQNMKRMFYECSSLTGLAVENWNVGKVKNMEYIFRGCKKLTSDKFNVSGWNVSSLTNFGGMFYGCQSLTSLDLSAWETGAATKMYEVFQGCANLTTLKIAGWKVSNVTSMSYMFYGCVALPTIDISGWNTEKCTTMWFMFAHCRGLTTLDLSNWDTNKVTDMRNMFDMGPSSGKLAKIYVGTGWSVAQVTSSGAMFKNCPDLEGGAGTKFNASNPTDKTYAIIDGKDEKTGYLTQGPAPTTTP